MKTDDREQRRLKRIASALDKHILGLLSKGRPLTDQNGFPVRDEKGELVYKPPTAADLNAICTRLKMCGITTGEGAKGNIVGNIMANLKFRPPDAGAA